MTKPARPIKSAALRRLSSKPTGLVSRFGGRHMRFWRKWIAAGQARVSLANKTTAGKLTGALTFALSLLATPSLAQQDIDALRAELFRNPANIQTNLAYLQSQLAEGNYTGAAATLQRVLMVDPESKLARVLYAEVQLRLGNKSDARLALDELIADPTTLQICARARNVLPARPKREKIGFSTSIAIAGGSSDNALGAPSASQILYLDRSFDNTTLEVSEAFTDYDLLVGFTYAPQSYVSQSFMVNVGIAGRQFASLEALNSHSTFGTLSYMRAGRTALSVGLTGYSTQVNDADYSGGQGWFSVPAAQVAAVWRLMAISRLTFALSGRFRRPLPASATAPAHAWLSALVTNSACLAWQPHSVCMAAMRRLPPRLIISLPPRPILACRSLSCRIMVKSRYPLINLPLIMMRPTRWSARWCVKMSLSA